MGCWKKPLVQADARYESFHAALAYEDPSFQESLKGAVAAAGGTVTRELRLSQLDEIGEIDEIDEAVLVVNLEPVLIASPDLLERLLRFPGKLILNDAEASSRLTGSARARWARHLAAKITDSHVYYPPAPGDDADLVEQVSLAEREVWVLAASIGGPEAMRSFLGELMPDTPFCIVLAQHIGIEFIELMAQQLDQASRLTVRTAIDGERFRPGKVYVVPPNKSFRLSQDDRIILGDARDQQSYSPDINQIIMDAVDRFGHRVNVIVFSGMASDAIEGCARVREAGGEVWVQTPETCVVSSMVDGALRQGPVGVQADPIHLAHRLNERGIERH